MRDLFASREIVDALQRPYDDGSTRLPWIIVGAFEP